LTISSNLELTRGEFIDTRPSKSKLYICINMGCSRAPEHTNTEQRIYFPSACAFRREGALTNGHPIASGGAHAATRAPGSICAQGQFVLVAFDQQGKSTLVPAMLDGTGKF
jgi:hypothetical protein